MENLEIWEGERPLGSLGVTRSRGHENFVFRYAEDWLTGGFPIDPSLPFDAETKFLNVLPPFLQDVCPDRWGRLLLSRTLGHLPSESECLKGVSDYFRVGATRIRKDGVFVDAKEDKPGKERIASLLAAIRHVERGETMQEDLRLLLIPGSSLGGARPKASIVMEDGSLWLAKFPSRHDSDGQIPNLEKTYLDAASVAGIPVCESRLLDVSKTAVLLVRRFDREAEKRIPFLSGMTALGVMEREGADIASYVDLAESPILKDATDEKSALFRRMVFNGLFGNTDDHLRNHAFLLRDSQWLLSPAYDLTPECVPYDRQGHALNFDGTQNLPSLDLFDRLRPVFGVDEKMFREILAAMETAANRMPLIARKNGVSRDNIRLLENNCAHDDFKNLGRFLHISRSRATSLER